MIQRFDIVFYFEFILLVCSNARSIHEDISEDLVQRVKCGSINKINSNETLLIESSIRDPCRLRLIANRCQVGILCQNSRSLWESELNEVDNDYRTSSTCLNPVEIKDEDGEVQKICLDRKSRQLINIKGPTIELNLAPPRRTQSQSPGNSIFNPTRIVQGNLFGALVGLRRCSVSCRTVQRTQAEYQQIVRAGIKKYAGKAQIGNGLREETCACGRRAGNLIKIVNGVETEIGEFPWQVALVGKGRIRPYCGASLINSRYVLTAAHCVVDSRINPQNIEVLINEHEIGNEAERNTTRHKIESILINPSYSSSTREARLFTGGGGLFNGPIANDYDAALLRLVEPVDITQTPPICLPKGESMRNTYAGTRAIVSGWGRTSESGDPSRVLLKADINVISNAECQRNYLVPNVISERMLCATGMTTPNRDSCFGDSGGPLVVNANGAYTQIGLVSWGFGCARTFPGVYSRVSEFVPWIAQHTKDGQYCSR